MKVATTEFQGLYVFEPKIHGDSRGYFLESYNKRSLASLGFDFNFVQDNQSRSSKGVLRGLHFQIAPHAQTKLIRVLSGEILDVVVDLRSDMSTFGKHYSIVLSGENQKQLLVPTGFAHGFVVLSDVADVFYKCDQYYHPASDGGINYSDAALGIDWSFPAHALTISDKDKQLPLLKDAVYKF
jgi:dTDP-4-dehydrorhamnose 3,5-epimerase